MILLFHKPLKVWPIVQRKCLCLISGQYYKNDLNFKSWYFPHMAEFMIFEAIDKLTTEQNR